MLPLLLCLSTDPDLRETRRLVLLTRFRVEALSSVDALTALSADKVSDLLVLCHTLTEDERASAVRIAREGWPAIKILQIAGPYATRKSGDVDAVVGGLAGPRAMFEAIQGLLANQVVPAQA